MRSKNRIKSTWGVLIFAAGVLTGMLFFGAAVWGDIEGFLFDTGLPADTRIYSLRCPILITEQETGRVTASIQNPTDREIKPILRVHISKGLLTLMREFDERPPIPPHQTFHGSWEVTAEDAVYDRLILVRVNMLRFTPLPSRTGSCGILVVNAGGLSGNILVALWTGASLVAMLVGGLLWASENKPLVDKKRVAASAFSILGTMVAAGIITSLMGWWLPGLLLFALCVLVSITIIAYFTSMA